MTHVAKSWSRRQHGCLEELYIPEIQHGSLSALGSISREIRHSSRLSFNIAAMRIFLLPISTTRTFIYCQRLNQQVSKEQTYIDKLTTRATNLWVKWEKYDKGWQKKVTEYGDKIFQRIPYEEWGLKSIPPLSASRKAATLEGMEKTDVTFPPSLIKPQCLEDVLRTLAIERQALHTKRMWWSIVGMPITAPVALIPV